MHRKHKLLHNMCPDTKFITKIHNNCFICIHWMSDDNYNSEFVMSCITLLTCLDDDTNFKGARIIQHKNITKRNIQSQSWDTAHWVTSNLRHCDTSLWNFWSTKLLHIFQAQSSVPYGSNTTKSTLLLSLSRCISGHRPMTFGWIVGFYVSDSTSTTVATCTDDKTTPYETARETLISYCKPLHTNIYWTQVPIIVHGLHRTYTLLHEK
jgi:hypothetical protein